MINQVDSTLYGYIFFFQAEDGIRDKLVTGVQTCALPISVKSRRSADNLLASEKVAKEKGEVRRALGEPAHEVAIPVLAVRDEHPEPEPVRGDARVQVLPDPVEHLDLESLARDPSRPRGVASAGDQPRIVRRDANVDRARLGV